MQFTVTVRPLPDLTDAEAGRLPFVITTAIGHAARAIPGVIDAVVTIDDPPALLTVAAASAVSGIPVASLDRLIALGQLPPGGFIRPADLNALRLKDAPIDPP